MKKNKFFKTSSILEIVGGSLNLVGGALILAAGIVGLAKPQKMIAVYQYKYAKYLTGFILNVAIQCIKC
ncbi:hypothetical protein [Pediococcus acidilactici]|uniref:hypothetical protein n=1 Tax=Pediococcus acidilactici TaxID=1254 RepID=UPI00307A757D